MALAVLISLLVVSQGSAGLDLWLDREEAEYYPTEHLRIFFQTDEDCFVAVYNVEMGGEVSRLFPHEEEDGWVQAGRIYELPPPAADYDYVITGPEGVEQVIAVASTERLPDMYDEGPDVDREIIELYVLEPEPATLRIITTPDNCRVYLTEVVSGEEQYIGKAPETVVIRPGEYFVEVSKFGYRTMRRKLWLDPGERRRIFVKLYPY
jgi:hypothetical protein